MASKRKNSAGILLFRRKTNRLEVLLVHPGGPFWAKKDVGAWSIPKGEFEKTDDKIECAKREFTEETGGKIEGKLFYLEPLKQKSGKIIFAWAVEGDYDESIFQSNTFEMEWPPRSGKKQTFPEVDKAMWFSLHTAQEKMITGQLGFLSQLEKLVRNDSE